MKSVNLNILALNGGSSSLKFALYEISSNPKKIVSGQIKRIGLDGTEFTATNHTSNKKDNIQMDDSDFKEVIVFFINWLQKQNEFGNMIAIGHRIVHGMEHTQAEIIDDKLLNELGQISKYDPDHLPAEIEMVRLFKKQFPELMQVACFDTAFHTTIPPVAKMFAIPKKYFDEGIQRYGFHGISYSYLMEELKKKSAKEAKGKIILAHLGNGASIAAVKDGKCIDTSMGFTPAAGIVMSTRSGDLDPGIAWYLMQKGITEKQFNDLINHQSGLLGISAISSDMKDLLQQEKENKNAALAIEIFCYQIKKYIGGYASALGGLGTLIFTGGIGENSAAIRSRICKGLQFLGIELDGAKNDKNEVLISKNKSRVKVYVIPTNEELMIVKETSKIYKKHSLM